MLRHSWVSWENIWEGVLVEKVIKTYRLHDWLVHDAVREKSRICERRITHQYEFPLGSVQLHAVVDAESTERESGDDLCESDLALSGPEFRQKANVNAGERSVLRASL